MGLFLFCFCRIESSNTLICFRFDRRKMEELLHKNQLSEERKEAEEKEEAIVR